MSDSENIALWKKKSEIDYTSLFVPLWLSLDAWMRDRYSEDTDRKRLELFKQGSHKISDDFFILLFDSNDARAKAFQGNLAELHKALENANMPYKDKFISFACIPDGRKDDEDQYINLLKEERQQNKIELVEGIWLDDDKSIVFRGFIEILYQIRCALFHGDLKPNEANERVIKQLYLITVEIMKRV